jgi:hypothetical protein
MQQQIERDLNDFVRIAAAQQSHTQLMQRQKVLVTLIILQQ